MYNLSFVGRRAGENKWHGTW